ncbi:uncharacterized protein DUF748 [Mucilaginibacter gracilis]|uniref:Uncharacterized protein DUF748 n=1 Tax=Mucilaginibacter gracilis TaxID=423350 RepID=A0A495JAX6_9SPHI|nr:DUF748 domain-containing protein [Mucilaginibacter gracilis]RKR85638.1 uncharacterized protein DUF748 [Mucilaginibacter gracilis]
MALNFLKKRWQKVAAGITLSVIVIISVLAFLINIYWSPVMADKLSATILESTDSLYSVSFSNTSLHVIRGRIVIDEINLRPNLEVYNRRKKKQLAPNSLYTLQIKRLVINHVHPLMLYFDDKLDIAQIVISNPNLHVDYEQNRDEDTVIHDKKTPYQLISKILKSAHVQSIVLNDVQFKYVDHSGSKPDVLELKNLNFIATDFLLDAVSQNDKSRFLFCKDVSTELNNLEGTTKDKRNHYNVDNATFSTQSSQLNITGISFTPVKTPAEFFKTTQADCYALKLDSLTLNNFDFKAYSKYHKIHASALTLTNGSLQIFNNPAPNDTTVDNGYNFPQLLLARLKMDVKVDTIQVSKTGISYTEYGKKSGQPGTINFTNTTGKFLNVTNNKAALQKNHTATAQIETYLMGNGRLNTQFEFDLNNPRAQFTYKGHMDDMELKKINPVAAPLGMVKIASGKLRSLDFNINADKAQARGNVIALYNDLKISVLKKDNENKLKKMGIVSLLANVMVIKRNNPSYGEPARLFKVNYVRKKNQSIFTYMWKSLFLGLKSNVGYDAETEKTVKRKISDFEQGKAERKIKKALRQQHRAERRERRELRKQQKELRKQQEAQTPL